MRIEDHQWCFERARIVLRNDHRLKLHLVDQFADEINKGLEEADMGLADVETPFGIIPIAPVMHFLNPYTHMGLGGWISIGLGAVTNAALFCNACFDIARRLWKRGEQNLSMRVFGMALHLVQDLTVPHHARCAVFFQHSEYEQWLHHNINQTANVPLRDGLYTTERYPAQWVYANAREAYSYFGYCDGIAFKLWSPRSWVFKNDNFALVRDTMVPLAVRTSAGFIDYFLGKLSAEH
ncbi:MAG: hypothetical protein ACOYU7_02820 [Bacillota bacterium]